MAAKPIVHFEIMGADGGALKDFYSDLFEWKLEAFDGVSDYYTTDGDETGVGGAVGQGNDHMPNYLTVYMQVDDIDAYLARVGKAGGSTLLPRTEVPDVVTFALFSDPAGNTVGLVEGE